MSSVAITGGFGFLGWHLASRLWAHEGEEPRRLGREAFATPDRLRTALKGIETVYHLAAVNRAGSDFALEQGNVELAEALVSALDGRAAHIVYANSVQADLHNAYGRGKRRAAEVLGAQPGTLANVLLPNLFGEHGRPAYNSFVATFCSEVAAGRQPKVTGDRELPLLHAQGAAQALMSAAGTRADSEFRPAAEPHTISQVLDRLNGFHEVYAKRGEIPDLSTTFAVDLFNTYRSFLFPNLFPAHPGVHRDERGSLFETVRSHGGTGQAFVSSTAPGATRGDHYHLRKVERFFVIKGKAEVAVRRLYHDGVVRFRLGGDHPGFVDMPTMWVHNITNVGEEDLVTMFWADQLLDPRNPDQFPQQVELA